MFCGHGGVTFPSSWRQSSHWTINWYRGERVGGLSNTGIAVIKKKRTKKQSFIKIINRGTVIVQIL